MSNPFVYEWIKLDTIVVLSICGRTFSMKIGSTEDMDRISHIESSSSVTIISMYEAKMIFARWTDASSTIVLSFFDAWGDLIGVYFIPEEIHNALVLEGYSMLLKLVKL